MTEKSRRERDLVFWSEWEPPSDVERIEERVKNGPRFLHRPYWTRPSAVRGLQNTDPFVFGGFFYSICRQLRGGQPTQLRHMSPGSVLLFGSHLRGRFVLDTVFVVRDYVDHDRANYRSVLKSVVPDAYIDIALAPAYESPRKAGCGKDASLRLYLGATFQRKVDGMFSFFPCRPHADTARGFARPAIRLPGIVNPACKQTGRIRRGLSSEQHVVLWRSVRKQVLAQGCQVAIAARFPQRRG